MSVSNLVCTGIVSLFSIPCIHYYDIIVNLRASFTILYLLVHCLMLPTKTLMLYTHHVLTICLILNTRIKGGHYTLENRFFFLEFSTFLMESSKVYNNQHFTYIAKAYWIYDRVYRFPFLLLKNSNVLSHVYINLMALCYIGIYWSYKIINFEFAHYWSLFTLFILNGVEYP